MKHVKALTNFKEVVIFGQGQVCSEIFQIMIRKALQRQEI